MRRMKRTAALLLCIVLVVTLIPTANLATARDLTVHTQAANGLYDLGLFRGTNSGFELGRAPTRTEALVMLIRVLGRESEAKQGGWSHPFTDVAAWADSYVGYAYENGLTKGVSATTFGSEQAADARMYTTFMLRALGYSDTDGADFTYLNPFTLAERLGLVTARIDTQNFLRADVALESYLALEIARKGTSQTLAQSLIEAGAFTKAQYDAAHVALPAVPTALDAEAVYAACSPAVFYIEVYDRTGTAFASGSGFFLDSSGTAVTNYHVIEDAYSAKATLSGSGAVYDVEGVYDYDIAQDWAVIKVKGSGFPYLPVGDAATVVGGATVYAIGSPLGLQNTISQGLISNPSRVAEGVTYIQTSAAISHGSSGGALINKYGEVVGITSASYTEGQNLNLALPITVIEGYRHNTVTALANLVAATLPTTGGTGQAAAYDWLRSFVLQNCNSNDFGKEYPAYRATVNESTEWYLLYDAELESVDLICITYKDTMESFTLLSLERTGGSVFLYADLCDNAYFGSGEIASGSAMLTPSDFDVEVPVTFSDYEGEAELRELFGELVSLQVATSLRMADSIFLAAGTTYSMEDFGFLFY